MFSTTYLLAESYLIGGDKPEVAWRHRTLWAVKAREEQEEFTGMLRLFHTLDFWHKTWHKNTIITNI